MCDFKDGRSICFLPIPMKKERGSVLIRPQAAVRLPDCHTKLQKYQQNDSPFVLASESAWRLHKWAFDDQMRSMECGCVPTCVHQWLSSHTQGRADSWRKQGEGRRATVYQLENAERVRWKNGTDEKQLKCCTLKTWGTPVQIISTHQIGIRGISLLSVASCPVTACTCILIWCQNDDTFQEFSTHWIPKWNKPMNENNFYSKKDRHFKTNLLLWQFPNRDDACLSSRAKYLIHVTFVLSSLYDKSTSFWNYKSGLKNLLFSASLINSPFFKYCSSFYWSMINLKGY